jgi:8-oxo-dGTP diphosphatase
MTQSPDLVVAVGLILNSCDEVLVATRPGQGNQYWEFPGGKLEPGESTVAALVRELREELSMDLDNYEFQPVIPTLTQQKQRTILLDAWVTRDFRGDVVACEGQQWQWCPVSQLRDIAFYQSNLPIVQALTQWLDRQTG